MQGKTAIANILQQEVVELVFCFPNNPLIDAIAAAGIRPVIARMERGAVNMADAYSRITNGRKTGVCIVQAGPGIENGLSRRGPGFCRRRPHPDAARPRGVVPHHDDLRLFGHPQLRRRHLNGRG